MILAIKRFIFRTNVNTCHICWNGYLCTKHHAQADKLYPEG